MARSRRFLSLGEWPDVANPSALLGAGVISSAIEVHDDRSCASAHVRDWRCLAGSQAVPERLFSSDSAISARRLEGANLTLTV